MLKLMRRRFRKQVTILAIVGGFFAAVGVGIWALVYEPPPPPPPPPPVYEALQALETRIFRTDGTRADLYAMVRNPNASVGVKNVPYTFTFLALGAPVGSVQGQAFFLPGQEKPVVAINVEVPDAVEDIRLTVGEPEWVPTDGTFRGPSLLVVTRQGAVKTGRPTLYQVKGVLANESTQDYFTVGVTALGYEANGTLLGVGRTFVGSLKSQDRREFTVSWPLPPGATVSFTREFPEVNVFSPSAVEIRAGVPGREPAPGVLPRPGV